MLLNAVSLSSYLSDVNMNTGQNTGLSPARFYVKNVNRTLYQKTGWSGQIPDFWQNWEWQFLVTNMTKALSWCQLYVGVSNTQKVYSEDKTMPAVSVLNDYCSSTCSCPSILLSCHHCCSVRKPVAGAVHRHFLVMSCMHTRGCAISIVIVVIVCKDFHIFCQATTV